MYSKCVGVRALNNHSHKSVFGIVCELRSPLLWRSLKGSERAHLEGRDADSSEMLCRYYIARTAIPF